MKKLNDLDKPQVVNMLLLINKIITIIFLIALIVLAYFLLTQPDKFNNFFDQLFNQIKYFFDLIFKGFLSF